MTDVQHQEFYAFERFSRGANDLAGARAKPFRVWVEDWFAESTKKDRAIGFPNLRIRAAEKNVSIDLELKNSKPVVLQGDRGLSQKGAEVGNASYYYSLTRINARGQLKIENNTFQVTGLAWLDREWSTSAPGKDQVGWDWFSLQLSDGREIMYYQIRKHDGQPDKFSSGTIIEKDGASRHLKSEDIIIKVVDHWTSALGGTYPSRWKIALPNERLELKIIPFLQNQELNVSLRYWEGAVRIEGSSGGKLIAGRGYVELTGYSDSNSSIRK